MIRKFNVLAEISCILFCAYSLAIAANHILAPRQLTQNTDIATAQPAPPAPPKPINQFQKILLTNLFNVHDPSQQKKQSPPTPARLTEMSVAKLKSSLLGTIYSSTPSLSRAVVQIGNHQELLKVGDKIENIPILEIRRRAIVVQHNGKNEVLLIDDNDASIAEANTNRYTVTRKWINEQIRDISSLARSVLLKPDDHGNGNAGLLVQSLATDSPLKQFDIRVGDLILEANGKKVLQYRNPIEAFRILDGNQLTLKVLRAGKPYTLTYTIAE